MAATERVEVAIVGAGPAGAALATLLARAGREVVLLERSVGWHWRAGGVFASPAAVAAVRRIGLDVGRPGSSVERVARPVPAMRVETRRGTTFRLTYGADTGGPPAVGFDRSSLDPALIALAAEAGAMVRRGWTVIRVEPGARRLTATCAGEADPATMEADVIVGADGPRSVVAAAAGVARPARLGPRIGLTFHLADGRDDGNDHDARIVLLRDGYVGIAPVPGRRVNVGMVLGETWRQALARDGAAAVARHVLASIAATDDDPATWSVQPPLDHVEGAWPLGHRVTRRAGPGWILVGDAAGFLDPFTGEGLHRAFVSAELAAVAIKERGRPSRSTGSVDDLLAYDQAMDRRFAAKDAVSWLVQGVLGRPTLFDYAARRLASRASVRATMGLVMGDLVPATRGLDPRFLARLLAP